MFVSKLKYWEQYRVKVNLKIQQVELNVVLLSIQESVQVTIWACFFSITCNWCKYFLHIFIAALCEFSGSTEHSCYSELYLTFKRIFKLQITSHTFISRLCDRIFGNGTIDFMRMYFRGNCAKELLNPTETLLIS